MFEVKKSPCIISDFSINYEAQGATLAAVLGLVNLLFRKVQLQNSFGLAEVAE